MNFRLQVSVRSKDFNLTIPDNLVRNEGEPWALGTVLRATRERVTQILPTAIVTGLALAPLAIENGQAGREIQGPMAIVILGGLASSLALTLLLLPALIWRWRYSGRELPPAHRL